MLEDHQETFNLFRQVHDQYTIEKQKFQKEFNTLGEKVQEIIREYEAKLCQHSEKGQYAKYSHNLAEKFQEEVKKNFPLIDFIGVEVVTQAKPDPIDSLPRIRL